MINKKKYLLLFLTIVILAVSGCDDKAKNKSIILRQYTNDLKFANPQIDYFLPEHIYNNYIQTFIKFIQNGEYQWYMQSVLSSEYILTAVHEFYSMYIRSEMLSIHVQFPDQITYETYLERFTDNPNVSKRDFSELLKYEYIVYLEKFDKLIQTGNYVHIEKPAYDGIPYYFLDKKDRDYFLSSDFTDDMDVISAWIHGKKWTDLDSVIIRKNERLFIYTFDPTNNLPKINSITKVVKSASSPNEYITQTGNYKFAPPADAADIETFENSNGSLDILYSTGTAGDTRGSGTRKGVRIYLTGAYADINQHRRIIGE